MATNTQCRRVFDECCKIGPSNWVDYGDQDWQAAAEEHAARFEELFVSVEVRDASKPDETQTFEIAKRASKS